MNSAAKFLFAIFLLGALTGAAIYYPELKWQWQRWSHSQAPQPPHIPLALPACAGCNLILISLDTLRADRMGFLGSTAGLTPNLDKIASQSINFKNAFTNAFFTTPSHMTVFTSLYPTTHRVEATNVKVPRLPKSTGPAIALPPEYETLAEVLLKQEYDTIWSGPLDFKFLSFKDGFGRGFKKTYPSPFQRGLHFPLNAPFDFDLSLFEKILNPSRKPFFLFLHSYVTHLPYVVDPEPNPHAIPYTSQRLLSGVEPIAEQAPDTLFPSFNEKNFDHHAAVRACTNFENMDPCFKHYVPKDNLVHRLGQWQLWQANRVLQPPARGPSYEEELHGYIQAYDYGVKALDSQIGKLWRHLETSGLLKSSVVIFFSDHGEELFDHGQGNHGSFYEHTARVPLLIYMPEQKQGSTSETLVSLVDVMPTALEILKVAVPKQAQGDSLGTKDPRDYVFGSSLGVSYVRSPQWKLVRGEQGDAELYFLDLDPEEKNNLIELRLDEIRGKTAELEHALSNWKLEQAL